MCLPALYSFPLPQFFFLAIGLRILTIQIHVYVVFPHILQVIQGWGAEGNQPKYSYCFEARKHTKLDSLKIYVIETTQMRSIYNQNEKCLYSAHGTQSVLCAGGKIYCYYLYRSLKKVLDLN